MGPSRKINQTVGKLKTADRVLSKKKTATPISCEDGSRVPIVKTVDITPQLSDGDKQRPGTSEKDQSRPVSSDLKMDVLEKKDDSLIELEDVFDTQLSSQDNLLELSQDGDMQCDVKWDYTSPETTKQLRKMRGKYSVQDVKKIIANFPDMPLKPVHSSFDHIKLSILPKSFETVRENHKVTRAAKQKAAKRWKNREKCRGAVEDMLIFLQQQQQRQGKEENTEAGDSSTGMSGEKGYSCEETPKDKTGLEDSWSDDDLFQDNSFLIQATQNLEKILPVMNKNNKKQQSDVNLCESNALSDSSSRSSDGFHQLSSSSSPASIQSVVDSTSVIPSSYSAHLHKQEILSANSVHSCGSKAVKGLSKPISFNNVKAFGKHINQPMTSNPYNRSVNSSLSVSNSNYSLGEKRLVNEKGVNGLNVPKQTNSNYANVVEKSKTSTVTAAKFPRQIINKSSSSLNSPFRRALSFDSSFVSKSDGDSKVKNVSEGQCKDKNLVSHQNMSFNSSFTDEMLIQATADIDTMWANPKSAVTDSKRDKSLLNCETSVSTSKDPQACSNASKGISAFHKDANIANTLLSPVRPMLQDTHARRLHMKPARSPVQTFLRKSFALEAGQGLKHRCEAGPHSSTPVKVLKKATQKDVVPEKPLAAGCSDSFLEDDSFMNDEALYESQILPILELAESQAAPKKPNTSASPVKYSPDEIEKKRLAALEKLRKNNCQMPSTSLQKGVIFEPSQIPISPQKCSQEEIDKKKKAAQRKLLAKTNSAGSINISPQGYKNTSDHKSPEKMSAINVSPSKCSQEQINLKREEALRKRRLKQQQALNRKS